MAASRPWFSEEERTALQEFWRIYQDRCEASERQVLGEAVATQDWKAYEEALAAQGAALGEQGLWVEVVEGELLRALAPALVQAYGGEPERLVAVLKVMGTFCARRGELLLAASQRARELSFRRSEHSLAITLESIGDAVIATDDQGRIERMNRVAQQLCGWQLEEAKGRPLDDIFRVRDEDSGKRVPSRIQQILREGQVLGLPSHSALLARDGSYRPIADSMAPIRDDEGVIHGVVVVFIDQTREREHETALRSLAESVESSREEERTRIARELHDELGQQLTAIGMDLGWLGPRLRSSPREVIERLEAMRHLVDSISAMVGRIGTDLRPGLLDDLGLAEAIEWQASEFERRSGIRVEVDTSSEIGLLGRSESTALFRIFQEILTNVARHAAAKQVVGQLSIEMDRVTLDVRDDGRGIRPEEMEGVHSLGLLGMRERATLHGGTFHIEALHSGGTHVQVTLPWTEATRS